MNKSKATDRDNSINNGASTSGINLRDNSNWSDFFDESILQMLDEPFEEAKDHSCLRNDEKYVGFDNNAGTTWIYPKNYPMRHYQYNITKAALFRNTLVVLPTGLGKTFIAAVVMYNIYRWYPTGKVIFMAPTKPLVSQQIEACRKIMGIPMKDTAEITGRQNKKLRQDLWQTKRVFFVTPHVVQNDIYDNEQDFPFNDIRLIVVDEAHKAKGRYAHCEAVQAIASKNPYFRVLALSATPGRRTDDVIEVIKNLSISHLEVRCENSLDVLPYTHKKSVKTVVVALGAELIQIRNDFIDIIDPYIRYLIDNQVISGSVSSISRGVIIMEQKRFLENSQHQKHPNESQVKKNFSICMSLYHALELLERHGTRVFLNFFDDPEHESAQRYYVGTNPKLRQFLNKLRQLVGPNPFLVNDQTMTNGKMPEIPQDLDFGHPKFLMVKNSLIAHFETTEDSRVIVFCEYRETVLLVYRALLQKKPLIKPRIFVGQGGKGSIRAVTQKQQLEVMQQFRAGICNTLIATSVAEEGIDVGEVDLIVCFDISTRNPTRFTQRIGRTGRRRQGNIIMMVTEGKEQAMLKEVLQSKDKLNQKVIKNRDVARMLFKSSPRIVPPEFNPKCLEMYMIINDEVDEKKPSKAKKVKETKLKLKETKPKLKANKKAKITAPSQKQDMRMFFKKVELDKEDHEIFCSPRLETSSKVFSDLEELDSVPNEFDSVPNELDSVPNELENLLKKINKLKSKPIRPDDTNCMNDYIGKLLRSSSITITIKRFILTSNLNYVKEKYEAIKALRAVCKDDDVHIVDDSELHLQIELNAIEKVLGKDKIEDFLIENEKQNFLADAEKKFGGIFQDLEKRHFEECVEQFLDEKIAELGLQDDCYSDENEKPESVVYEDFIEAQSEVFDEPFNPEIYDGMEVEYESRYTSQWTQFDRNKISDQSTPLQVVSRSDVNMKNVIGKELFPIEEFDDDDPFGVVEGLKKDTESCSKAVTDIEIVAGKESLNKSIDLFEDEFDDDFDDLLIKQVKSVENKDCASSQSEGYTVEEILRIVAEKEKAKKFDQVTEKFEETFAEDCTIAVQTKPISSQQNAPATCTSRIAPISGKISQRAENKIIFQEFGKYDYKEFFEPFDYNPFEAVVVAEKPDAKICNESENIFENIVVNANSSNMPSNMSRKVSVDLFPSGDESSTVFKSQETRVSPTQDRLEVIPAEEIKSPSILDRRTDLEEWREIIFSCSLFAKKNTTVSKQLFGETEIEHDCKEATVTTKINEKRTHKAIEMPSDIESSCSVSAFQRNTKRAIRSSDEDEDLVIPCSQVVSTSSYLKKMQLRKPIHKAIEMPSEIESSCSVSAFQQNNKRVIRSSDEDEDLVIPCSQIVSTSSSLKKIQLRKPIHKAIKMPSEIESSFSVSAFQRNNKRATRSSDEDEDLLIPCSQVENSSRIANMRHVKRRKFRHKPCQFINDEAIVIDDDDDDALDTEVHAERSEYQIDSVVVCDTESEDYPDVDMQAKYLQSVRSPIKGAFKIPAPRTFNDMSRIFSQAVPYENISAYKEDSFVVNSDNEDEVEDNDPSQECPLERAEAILKARRRAKRQKRLDDYLNLDGYEFGPNEEDDEEAYHEIKMRRRNIYKFRDSSEDDDDFE